jgi:hypothetical protein
VNSAIFHSKLSISASGFNCRLVVHQRMKFFINIAVLFWVFSNTLLAQEWNLALARDSKPVTILVPAKSLIEFGSTRAGNQSGQSVTLDFGNGASVKTTTGAFPDSNSRWVGPLTLTIEVYGGSSAFYAIPYRIVNSTAVSVTPSGTIVIPSNASGNVQIIMESSSDLVTWTASSPGTYGSSTANRFFRIRAVQQE